MKSTLTLSMALLFCTILSAQTLSGKWYIVEEGDTTMLELNKDSVFRFTSKNMGMYLEGLNTYSPDLSEDDSIFIDHKYVCDVSTFPHQLVLTGYYANTDSISFVIPTYFEFREDGSLLLFFHEEGVLMPDEDDIKKEVIAFYKNTPLKKENYEEALLFKLLK